MGRTYAGVLGLLAFGLLLARGLLLGAGAEGTLATACGGLFGFAAAGLCAGMLADRFTSEAVKTRFEAALKSMEDDRSKSNKSATAT
jgi:hypothetical protein